MSIANYYVILYKTPCSQNKTDHQFTQDRLPFFTQESPHMRINSRLCLKHV